MSSIPMASGFHRTTQHSYSSEYVENLRRNITSRLMFGFKAAEEKCSLDDVLNEVREVAPERYRKMFDTLISRPPFKVRMSKLILKRTFALLFEGLISAGSWCNSGKDSVQLNTRICLSGFGVFIEIIDNRVCLSQKLFNSLAQNNTTVPSDSPGLQLFKARDILEHHGGRLSFRTLEEGKCGIKAHIYLPLQPTETSWI